jgi:hypothetical protein
MVINMLIILTQTFAISGYFFNDSLFLFWFFEVYSISLIVYRIKYDLGGN